MPRVPSAILLVCLVLLSASTARTATIKLGSFPLMLASNDEFRKLSNMTHLGMEAAVAQKNAAGGLRGQQLELVKVETRGIPSEYAGHFADLMAKAPDVVALVGNFGDEEQITLGPLLKANSLANLAPVTAGQAYHYYTDEHVFIRPDPLIEVAALVSLATQRFRLKRLGFMYKYHTNGGVSDFGRPMYEGCKRMLAEQGLELISVTAELANDANYSAITAATTMLFDEPDAVFIYGGLDVKGVEFIVALLTHPLANPNLIFLCGESWASLVRYAFYYAKMDPTNRVFTSLSVPVAGDTSFEVSRNAEAALRSFWTPAVYDTFSGVEKQVMALGYVSMRFAIEVLTRSSTLTRQDVRSSLFQNQLYTVDDLHFGIFAGECPAGSQRTLCRCNEGARQLQLSTVTPTGFDALQNGVFPWPLSVCNPTSIKTEKPLNLAQLLDSGSLNGSATELRTGMNLIEFSSINNFNGAMEVYNVSNPTTSAVKLNRTTSTTVAIGSIFGNEPSIDDIFAVVDPMTEVAQLSGQGFTRNVLYPLGTLEQEIHAVVSTAVAMHGGSIAVLASTQSGDIVGAVKRSLNTLGVEAPASSASFTIGGLTQALRGVLPSAAVALVLGVTAADAGSIATVLGEQSSGRVALCSTELSINWDTVVSTLSAAYRDRVIFSSPLPNWGPSNASALSVDFNTRLAASGSSSAFSRTNSTHPLVYRGYIQRRLIGSVWDFAPTAGSSGGFLSAWYTQGTIALDADTTLGPFSDAVCAGIEGQTCQCSVGPRRMNIFSVASIFTDTAALAAPLHTATFSSCGVVYRPLEEPESLSSAVIAGIAAGSVVAALLLVVFIFRASRKTSRDSGYAPKDASKPYTIAFTDVESSTSLWARCPEHMAVALDAHHTIVRAAIVSHRGYEVKTVGDSFMVAFIHADDAAAFAVTVQKNLKNHAWGTSAFDDAYLDWEREKFEALPPDAGDNTMRVTHMQTFNLDKADYQSAWSGLRVRIGLNTGIGEIRLDEVHGAYDYYGTVVNAASRIEAAGNGGQIVVSEATLKAFRAKAPTYNSVELGPTVLRGLSEPTLLFQLDGVSGRAFGSLRGTEGFVFSEMGESVSEPGEDDRQSVSKSQSYQMTVDNESEGTAAAESEWSLFLQTTISVMKPSAQSRLLGELCEKWRVSRPSDSSPAAISQAMQQLASKIGRVHSARHRGMTTASRRNSAEQLGSKSGGRLSYTNTELLAQSGQD